MMAPDAVTSTTVADMGQAMEIGFQRLLIEFCKEFRRGGRVFFSDRFDDLLFTHEKILRCHVDWPERLAAYSSAEKICGLECVTSGDVVIVRRFGLEELRWLVVTGLQ